MSLKSFDKFCEAMVNPDKDKHQEIFDERQKQMQLHLVVEAMIIFISLMFIHCFISDFFFKWSESNLFPMLLYAMLCLIYYIIRAGAKGCYIGINGAVSKYAPTIACILIGFMNGFRAFLELSDNGYRIIKDGMVTDEFLGLVTFALMMITGIATLIFINRSEREEKNKS